MRGNTIYIKLLKGMLNRSLPLYQYDYGQVLRFSDLSLPPAYEVHFSNNRTYEDAAVQIGDENGVAVPEELIQTGKPVYA